MSSVLSMLRTECRRSVGAPVFVPLLGLVVWLAWYSRPFEVYVWLDAASAIRETALFVGPVVGGISAWAATRDRRRGTGELLAVTPRPPAARALVAWGGTALWAVAVYAALTAFLFSLTWWNATWGAPPPGYLLVTILGVLANSALGFAAGLYLPSRFTVPLTAVVLFAAQVLPLNLSLYRPNYELLTPAPNSLVYRDVFHPVPNVAGQQSLWFLGLIGAALAAVALKNRGGGRPAWISLAASVTVAIVGFAASVGVDQKVTNPLQSAEPYDPVCEEGRITVCVHPAYEAMLPELARTMDEISRPLAGVSGLPSRAIQTGDTMTIPEGMVAESTTPFNAYGLLEGDREWFESSLSESLVRDVEDFYGGTGFKTPRPTEEDRERCGGMSGGQGVSLGPPEQWLDPALEAQEVVRLWLIGWDGTRGSGLTGFSMHLCSNTDEMVDRFASLDPGRRKAWLEDNFAGLRAGEVTLKDLP